MIKERATNILLLQANILRMSTTGHVLWPRGHVEEFYHPTLLHTKCRIHARGDAASPPHMGGYKSGAI